MGRTVYLKYLYETAVSYDFTISIFGVSFSFINNFDITHYQLVSESGQLLFSGKTEKESREWADENGFTVEYYDLLQYDN